MKKTTKFGPKKLLKINSYEKATKKEKRSQPSKTSSLFRSLLSLLVFIIKNKRGRKKEKEGRGFGRLPSFSFPPFLLISHNRLF